MKKHTPFLALIASMCVGAFSVHAQAADAAKPAAAIQAPAPPPKAPWESTLTAGLTLTRGNSETMTAAGAATTGRKWNQNELKLGIDGTYGESTVNNNKTVSANMIHGFGQYNRLFTERFFAYLRAEALHDEVADVKYRVTLSPGAGYYFIKNPSTDLDLEIGPGFVIQKQGNAEDKFATFRAGENFDHKLNDRAKIWQKTEYLPKLQDSHYFIVNSEIGVSAAITTDKKLSLTVTLDHTYNSEPAAGRLKNDTTLKTGITYAF
jgi:putative salt-induced outer membrane protein YdiY